MVVWACYLISCHSSGQHDDRQPYGLMIKIELKGSTTVIKRAPPTHFFIAVQQDHTITMYSTGITIDKGGGGVSRWFHYHSKV
jgi:hypothetical protein